MSKPKRYSIRGFSAAMVEEDNGVMVKWEDYAALQAETVRQLEAAIPPVEAYIVKLEAENERLSKLFANTERLMLLDGEFEAAKVGTYAALQAENERLRKAGDEMAFNYEQMASHDGVYSSDLMKFVQAWLAAKGVQP